MTLKHFICITTMLVALTGCNPFGGGSNVDGGGGWQDALADVAGGVMLDSEEGILFHGYDAMAYPAQKTQLMVRVQLIKRMKGISDVTVTFYDEDNEELGSAVTNGSGIAKYPFTPPKEGNYPFTAKIVDLPDDVNGDADKIESTPILVMTRNKQAKFIVIDLDHTVVASSFNRVLTFGAKPMPKAKDVLERIEKDLDYNVIYLTHRPGLMTRKSKDWLVENGFPQGPLLAAQLSDIPNNEGYKADQIAKLKEAYPNTRIGVGDKIGDARAYISNDLATFLLPHLKEGADAKDMYALAKEIEDLPAHEDLYVVTNWREVEVAIFNEVRFPAKVYVRRLRQRADEQADREDREDDDDEDEDDDDD
jgi:hypothetical protein